MHFRPSVKSIVLVLIVLPGCSLPRGPINIDPLVPHWLAQGELSTECPADLDPHLGTPVDPSALEPPLPRFHAVPTRPVFEPAGMPVTMPATAPVLTATR